MKVQSWFAKTIVWKIPMKFNIIPTPEFLKEHTEYIRQREHMAEEGLAGSEGRNTVLDTHIAGRVVTEDHAGTVTRRREAVLFAHG